MVSPEEATKVLDRAKQRAQSVSRRARGPGRLGRLPSEVCREGNKTSPASVGEAPGALRDSQAGDWISEPGSLSARERGHSCG